MTITAIGTYQNKITGRGMIHSTMQQCDDGTNWLCVRVFKGKNLIGEAKTQIMNQSLWAYVETRDYLISQIEGKKNGNH
jgi:hypothetical protein